MDLAPRHTRRWHRRLAAHTALAEFPDRECLGKVLDLSEDGVGLLLQGTRHRVGERLKLIVAFPRGTLGFRGTVVFTQPFSSSSRVGVRFVEPRLEQPAGSKGIWPASADRAGIDDREVGLPFGCPREGKRRAPFRVNLGVHTPLASPPDEKAMAAERSQLLQSMSHLGMFPAAGTYESLLERARLEVPQGLRSRLSRELFRMAMRRWYPAYPGTTVRGRLLHVGGTLGTVPLAGAIVTLDRFAVAESDASGQFTAEGIPILDASAVLPVGIRRDGLRPVEEVFASVRGGLALDLYLEIPVRGVPLEAHCDDALAQAFSKLCEIGSGAEALR